MHSFERVLRNIKKNLLTTSNCLERTSEMNITGTLPNLKASPCPFTEKILYQPQFQARKFGPGCPWSYRNWVPPRQVKPKPFEVP